MKAVQVDIDDDAFHEWEEAVQWKVGPAGELNLLDVRGFTVMTYAPGNWQTVHYGKEVES